MKHGILIEKKIDAGQSRYRLLCECGDITGWYFNYANAVREHGLHLVTLMPLELCSV